MSRKSRYSPAIELGIIKIPRAKVLKNYYTSKFSDTYLLIFSTLPIFHCFAGHKNTATAIFSAQKLPCPRHSLVY